MGNLDVQFQRQLYPFPLRIIYRLIIYIICIWEGKLMDDSDCLLVIEKANFKPDPALCLEKHN